MGPDQPSLPKPPDDPENLNRLREEARRRMEEESMRDVPRPVYGGPPITRRWTLRGLLLLIAGALAAIAAAIWGYQKVAVPVYGGPPTPAPEPPVVPPTPPPAAAVYGGPPPQPAPEPRASQPPPNPVYGGPAPPSPTPSK